MRAILLVVHVLSALWATVAFAASAAYAQLALRRPRAEEVARYFGGGPGLASRGALGVLGVSGVALVAVGDAQPSALWVQVGMSVWALVATTAGVGMWPAERRLQAGQGRSGTGWSLEAPALYRRVMRTGAAAIAALLAAAVVMTLKPG